MNRLNNAQKSLAESLVALESVVLHSQNLFSQSDAIGVVDEIAGLTAAAAVVDLGQLSHEVAAIEADLATAIRMIAEMAERYPSGDST